MKPILNFCLKLIVIPLLVVAEILTLLSAFILWDKNFVPKDDIATRLFKKRETQ